MARFAVWFEGVDFGETLFDTEKLSVVRGASRALEALPALVGRELASAGKVERIASGASLAGFMVDGEEATVAATVKRIARDIASRGQDHAAVGKACEAASRHGSAAEVLAAAPFAHFHIHGDYVPATGGDDAAIAQARAKVRRLQLSGAGIRPLPAGSGICTFDHARAADARPTHAPRKDGSDEASPISAPTAARWHYGRMERQLLYLDAGLEGLRFTDSFRGLCSQAPKLPDGKAMPVSVRHKLAVFVADGDGFGRHLIPALTEVYGGHGRGLRVLSTVLKARMTGLLKSLAEELCRMPPGVGKTVNKKGIRFETLLFGGDDVMFVVPAWLGFWLARRFFEETRSWTITDETVRQMFADEAAKEGLAQDPPQPKQSGYQPIPMSFSAGMVFAQEKTPIRSLRALAMDLLYSAKGAGGGLDIEVLESIEPPHGGLEGHRRALTRGEALGRFVTPHNEILAYLDRLVKFWRGNAPLPASQAYRALRAGLDQLPKSAADATPQEHQSANQAVVAELDRYVARAPEQLKGEHEKLLGQAGLAGVPVDRIGGQMVTLMRLLQHRHYIIADQVAGAEA